jgi:hypothetical protein
MKKMIKTNLKRDNNLLKITISKVYQKDNKSPIMSKNLTVKHNSLTLPKDNKFSIV